MSLCGGFIVIGLLDLAPRLQLSHSGNAVEERGGAGVHDCPSLSAQDQAPQGRGPVALTVIKPQATSLSESKLYNKTTLFVQGTPFFDIETRRPHPQQFRTRFRFPLRVAWTAATTRFRCLEAPLLAIIELVPWHFKPMHFLQSRAFTPLIQTSRLPRKDLRETLCRGLLNDLLWSTRASLGSLALIVWY